MIEQIVFFKDEMLLLRWGDNSRDDCLRKYFPEEAELILGQEEHYDYPTP